MSHAYLQSRSHASLFPPSPTCLMCFHLLSPSEFTLQDRALTLLHPFPIRPLYGASLHLSIFFFLSLHPSITLLFPSPGGCFFPASSLHNLSFSEFICNTGFYCFIIIPPSFLSVSLPFPLLFYLIFFLKTGAASKLSLCSAFALCAALLSSPLCAILHCSSLLSPHLQLSSFCFSTCIPVTLCALVPAGHCYAVLCRLEKSSELWVLLCQSWAHFSYLQERDQMLLVHWVWLASGFFGSVGAGEERRTGKGWEEWEH